jgi:hypothetical protein
VVLIRCLLVVGFSVAPCAASPSQPWASAESTLPSSSCAYRLLAQFQSVGALREYPRGWFRDPHPMSRSEAAQALKSVLEALDHPKMARWEYWGYREEDRLARDPLLSEGVHLLRPELARLGVDVDRELLIEALDRNDLTAVRELRTRTRSPLTQGRFGITVLMLASAYGDEALVQSELGRGAQTEVWDSTGATALFYAAAFGTVAVVQRLAKAGAVLDQHDADWTHKTPLMYAALGGRVHTTRALLRLGANPTETATWDHRASYFVPTINGEMSSEHRRVKKILLEAEAAHPMR